MRLPFFIVGFALFAWGLVQSRRQREAIAARAQPDAELARLIERWKAVDKQRRIALALLFIALTALFGSAGLEAFPTIARGSLVVASITLFLAWAVLSALLGLREAAIDDRLEELDGRRSD